ncbi:hypothetical protein CCR75_003596 [Bremia lactucae]|uniref:Uncharacterized protein n=1 Tax=Bremia lactucae TaxID=4779 RepID=A0A976FMV9_BRELC|nr:hypothetical protein CCR75_003596 [Bremia lactucae]
MEGDGLEVDGKIRLASADMSQLNVFEDSAKVNNLILKRITDRDWLDIVHARRGLPTLDQAYLLDDLDDLLCTEERPIHTAYGADAYTVRVTAASVSLEGDTEYRYVTTGQQ